MKYNLKWLAPNLAAKQLNQDIFTNINKKKWWQLQGKPQLSSIYGHKQKLKFLYKNILII